MQDRDEVQFHSARAMAELDWALRADSSVAAEAHFRLSALHLEKVKVLSGSQVIPMRIHAH
jgi:hypothetical protein